MFFSSDFEYFHAGQSFDERESKISQNLQVQSQKKETLEKGFKYVQS